MSSEVIQKYFNNRLEIVENQGHRLLKCSFDVFKAKRHFLICKCSPRTNKCILMLVLGFNLYLIISRKSVHKGKNLATRTLIQNLINKWWGNCPYDRHDSNHGNQYICGSLPTYYPLEQGLKLTPSRERDR